MDGVDTGTVGKRLGDLHHAVARGIEHDDLDVGPHPGHEQFIIRHGGIDKGNFGCGLAW